MYRHASPAPADRGRKEEGSTNCLLVLGGWLGGWLAGGPTGHRHRIGLGSAVALAPAYPPTLPEDAQDLHLRQGGPEGERAVFGVGGAPLPAHPPAHWIAGD
jgi:hypothetical protein